MTIKRVLSTINLTGDYATDLAAAVKQGVYLSTAKPKATDLKASIEAHNDDAAEAKAVHRESKGLAPVVTKAVEVAPVIEVVTVEEVKPAIAVGTVIVELTGDYGKDCKAAIEAGIIEKMDRPKKAVLEGLVERSNAALAPGGAVEKEQAPATAILHTSAPDALDGEYVVCWMETDWHWQEQGDVRKVTVKAEGVKAQTFDYQSKGFVALDEAQFKRKSEGISIDLVSKKAKKTTATKQGDNMTDTTESKKQRSSGLPVGSTLGAIGEGTSMAAFVKMLMAGPQTYEALIKGSDLADRTPQAATVAVPKRLKRINQKGYGFQIEGTTVTMILPTGCTPLFNDQTAPIAKVVAPAPEPTPAPKAVAPTKSKAKSPAAPVEAKPPTTKAQNTKPATAKSKATTKAKTAGKK